MCKAIVYLHETLIYTITVSILTAIKYDFLKFQAVTLTGCTYIYHISLWLHVSNCPQIINTDKYINEIKHIKKN